MSLQSLRHASYGVELCFGLRLAVVPLLRARLDPGFDRLEFVRRAREANFAPASLTRLRSWVVPWAPMRDAVRA
jgi:hypothetical protein